MLGAAAVLHRECAGDASERTWDLMLAGRSVTVTTSIAGGAILAEMNQGPATFGAPLSAGEAAPLLQRLRLAADDVADGLPLQVVSTGLPYLVVPVRADGLGRADGTAGRELDWTSRSCTREPRDALWYGTRDAVGFECRPLHAPLRWSSAWKALPY